MVKGKAKATTVNLAIPLVLANLEQFRKVKLKERASLCSGLKCSGFGVHGNGVYNKNGGLIGHVNSQVNRVFSINCTKIIKDQRNNQKFCCNCNSIRYYIQQDAEEYKPIVEDKKPTYDLLVQIEKCIESGKISENSACYKFLLGIFEAISKASAPNGLRYNKFVSAIFLVIFRIGKPKLIHFLHGAGWGSDKFVLNGIFPCPSVSTLETWSSKEKIKEGFSSIVFDAIISQFKNVCKDDTLYIGMTTDEMQINKGLVLDRKGNILGFPNYKSPEMFEERDSIVFIQPENEIDIVEQNIVNLEVQPIEEEGFNIEEDDKYYYNFIRVNTPKEKNVPADKIVVFFLVLHNGKGKKVRKFCAYFPILSRGHNAQVNGALFLQGILALSKTLKKYPSIRFSTVTMDGDSSHRKMFTGSKNAIFPVNLDTGSFWCPFIHQQCYYFQDPEHIIKRIRNNIFKSRDPNMFLLNKGQVISWQLLLILVMNDEQKPMRNTLLRTEDVILNDKTKMKTTYANNITKSNVRQQLQETFGSDANTFCELLEAMNDFLFVFRHWMPLGLDKESRITKIEKVKQFFYNWKHESQTDIKKNLGINHKTKLNPGLFNDILITITSFLSFYQEAKGNNITIIPRTISQNPVENIFCLIRQFSGGIRNPSIREVVGAISGIVHTERIGIISKSTSYEVDSDSQWFNNLDSSVFEERNKFLSTLEINKNKKIYFEPNQLMTKEDYLTPIKRISASIMKKKRFEMKRGSSILEHIIFWMISVLKPNIIQQDLLSQLQQEAKTLFNNKFNEELCISNKYHKTILFDKVLQHMSKICVVEYMYNKRLGISPGNAPFRDSVNSKITNSVQPNIINLKSCTPENFVKATQVKSIRKEEKVFISPQVPSQEPLHLNSTPKMSKTPSIPKNSKTPTINTPAMGSFSKQFPPHAKPIPISFSPLPKPVVSSSIFDAAPFSCNIFFFYTI